MEINCFYCGVLLHCRPKKWINPLHTHRNIAQAFPPASSSPLNDVAAFMLLSSFKIYPNICNFNSSSPPKNSTCLSPPLVLHSERWKAQRSVGKFQINPGIYCRAGAAKGYLSPGIVSTSNRTPLALICPCLSFDTPSINSFARKFCSH